jgi:hypothetical protein
MPRFAVSVLLSLLVLVLAVAPAAAQSAAQTADPTPERPPGAAAPPGGGSMQARPTPRGPVGWTRIDRAGTARAPAVKPADARAIPAAEHPAKGPSGCAAVRARLGELMAAAQEGQRRVVCFSDEAVPPPKGGPASEQAPASGQAPGGGPSTMAAFPNPQDQCATDPFGKWYNQREWLCGKVANYLAVTIDESGNTVGRAWWNWVSAAGLDWDSATWNNYTQLTLTAADGVFPPTIIADSLIQCSGCTGPVPAAPSPSRARWGWGVA